MRSVMAVAMREMMKHVVDRTLDRRNGVGSVEMPASFRRTGNQEKGGDHYCDHQQGKSSVAHSTPPLGNTSAGTSGFTQAPSSIA
jgi:hypothetical protein